jgi:hypothetical protein
MNLSAKIYIVASRMASRLGYDSGEVQELLSLSKEVDALETALAKTRSYDDASNDTHLIEKLIMLALHNKDNPLSIKYLGLATTIDCDPRVFEIETCNGKTTGLGLRETIFDAK